MNRDTHQSRRESALTRAERYSPFLREVLKVHPQIAETFLADGAEAAAGLALALAGDDVESELRRRRGGLALAVALGDLAGDLSLESATRRLSDFADAAIDTAV